MVLPVENLGYVLYTLSVEVITRSIILLTILVSFHFPSMMPARSHTCIYIYKQHTDHTTMYDINIYIYKHNMHIIVRISPAVRPRSPNSIDQRLLLFLCSRAWNLFTPNTLGNHIKSYFHQDTPPIYIDLQHLFHLHSPCVLPFSSATKASQTLMF